MAVSLSINGARQQLDVSPDMPLLWALRDHAGLTGTKYGCGMSLCGACTVYLDGSPVRSCVTPVKSAEGKSVTTIEGATDDLTMAVKAAWERLQVPQCGYCQSGQVLAAAALLRETPNPSDADIDSAMSGNICRCNTYQRIRAGIHAAAEKLKGSATAASGQEVRDHA